MSPKLLYVVTDSSSVAFLRGQLRFMRERGYDVHVCSSHGPTLDDICTEESATAHTVPLRREIHPLFDVYSLFLLLKLMRRLRPSIVNAGTPKAGLLASVAALLAGVPVRIYQLRGLRLETTDGVRFHILRLCEKIAMACSSRVLAVSSSLASKAISLGLCNPDKMIVLGFGSSRGVDLVKFSPSGPSLRSEFGLSSSEFVVGFVGRLTKDKGLSELIAAWEVVRSEERGVRLAVIGPWESGDPVKPELRARFQGDPSVSLLGHHKATAAHFRMFDLFVFPSYREGFPNVVLEAAACGLPTVGFTVTGTVDAVVDGVTGTLVEPKDSRQLALAILRYIRNHDLIRSHGSNARERVEHHFQPEDVWANLEGLYCELLRSAKARV